METWKDIEGYEGLYQVSDYGNIRNVRRNKNLKPSLNKYGYLIVSLFKNGNKKYFSIHRLVAEAFIPNPENKPTVDHINTIRTDNRVSNLRWLTHKEQMVLNNITREKHSKVMSAVGKRTVTNVIEKRKKKVLCVTTGEIFNSARDAARHYNIKDINGVCSAANPNHNQKTAGKLPDGTPLEWEYI